MNPGPDVAALRRRTPVIPCPECRNVSFSYVIVEGKYRLHRCSGPRGCGHEFDPGKREPQSVRDAWAALNGVEAAAGA